MAKIKAAVIFGGTAQEHELSLASAAEVIRNIPTDKYEVICIGVTKKGRWLYYPGGIDEIADGSWYLNPDCASAILSPDPIHHGIVTIENGEATIRRIDVAFPIMMGKKGADGTIQGLLDLSGIPYVGCGLLNNIDKRCEEIAESLGFPVVVKPAKSGCSIGTTIADDMKTLIAAVKIAFSNDNKVVVEKYVNSRKLEVAVFGYDVPFASYIGEILSVGKKYDPTEVKKSSGDDLKVPADLPNEVHNEIRAVAIKAFKALGCKGMARIDFFLTDDGDLLLNKVGTAPGLRNNSVYPKLMHHLGMEMPYLMDKLLEQAIENAEKSY